MEDRFVKREFIFVFQLRLVQVNEREEKNLTEFINTYGTLANVPKGEIISVYFIKNIKDKFIADKNYFYVEINELKSVGELTIKRSSVLTNFYKLFKIKN